MTASPKPAKGTAAKAKRARRRLVVITEWAAKIAAKERDGWMCRRCGDPETDWMLIEAAHIEDAGAGGDPLLLRGGDRASFVSLCAGCHRGPRSVHSGHIVMVVGPLRGDGPVEFRERVNVGAKDGVLA